MSLAISASFVTPFMQAWCWNYVGETLSPASLTRIQLCGRLVAVLNGRRVEGLLPGRKGRLLFAYLVTNRYREATAGELMEAMWTGPVPSGADTTLRALISKSRRAVGSEALGRGGRYRLDLPADARVDVEQARDAIHRAETAVAEGDWLRAWGPSQVALFTARRGFLPGEEAPWVEELRRELAELELRALECYTAASIGIGGTELPGAERSARRLVEKEPFRESGYRLLMRALAESGNLADALLVYERLREMLREELGVSPSNPTQALHATLLRRT
jgi:DNA-binding SARP family transcriptional activator